jgi:hypothetical protein
MFTGSHQIFYLGARLCARPSYGPSTPVCFILHKTFRRIFIPIITPLIFNVMSRNLDHMLSYTYLLAYYSEVLALTEEIGRNKALKITHQNYNSLPDVVETLNLAGW